MFKQNKIILLLIIMTLALTAGCGVNSPQAEKVRPIDSSDHVFGQLNAPVKIIIYSDFECPYCADFSQAIKQTEQAFGDKVAVAFRHYPLAGHPEAETAAEASECAAEQGKFWGMHDKLFADNMAGRMSPEQFKADAVDLSLDAEKFNQCLDSGKYKAKVAEQLAEGKRVGVTGTPTFFLNGLIYPGAYPFEDFPGQGGKMEKGLKSLINELLK